MNYTDSEKLRAFISLVCARDYLNRQFNLYEHNYVEQLDLLDALIILKTSIYSFISQVKGSEGTVVSYSGYDERNYI